MSVAALRTSTHPRHRLSPFPAGFHDSSASTRFFWRELKLRGARVNEPEDFEPALALAASGNLRLDHIVTAIQPLEALADAMHQLEGGGPAWRFWCGARRADS